MVRSSGVQDCHTLFNIQLVLFNIQIVCVKISTHQILVFYTFLENTMARYDDEDRNEISTGEWIVSLILSYIPLIGLIMLFVWAFGGGTSPTKANWAKAQLIIVVATFGLAIALYLTILASLAQQYGSMPH